MASNPKPLALKEMQKSLVHIMKSGLDAMPLFLLDDLLKWFERLRIAIRHIFLKKRPRHKKLFIVPEIQV